MPERCLRDRDLNERKVGATKTAGKGLRRVVGVGGCDGEGVEINLKREAEAR